MGHPLPNPSRALPTPRLPSPSKLPRLRRRAAAVLRPLSPSRRPPSQARSPGPRPGLPLAAVMTAAPAITVYGPPPLLFPRLALLWVLTQCLTGPRGEFLWHLQVQKVIWGFQQGWGRSCFPETGSDRHIDDIKEETKVCDLTVYLPWFLFLLLFLFLRDGLAANDGKVVVYLFPSIKQPL